MDLSVEEGERQLLIPKIASSIVLKGDSNSSFYHKSIKIRRKSNRIDGLLIGNNWVEDVGQVKKENFEHFKMHFSNSHRS